MLNQKVKNKLNNFGYTLWKMFDNINLFVKLTSGEYLLNIQILFAFKNKKYYQKKPYLCVLYTTINIKRKFLK